MRFFKLSFFITALGLSFSFSEIDAIDQMAMPVTIIHDVAPPGGSYWIVYQNASDYERMDILMPGRKLRFTAYIESEIVAYRSKYAAEEGDDDKGYYDLTREDYNDYIKERGLPPYEIYLNDILDVVHRTTGD